MTQSARRSGRRHPLFGALLLVIGLFATGGAYAATSAGIAHAETTPLAAEALVEEGEKLFMANCASCHGMSGEGSEAGPSVIGVGALSVDFQVSTGRMPMAASGPQAAVKPVQFTQPQTDAMAAWVASLAPGPGYPDPEYYDAQGDVANGAELFRINCAMCHNVAGAGGALTEGKYAPHLRDLQPINIYGAMVTGPQNMPVFNDMNLSPEEKNDVISYLKYMDENPSVGGFSLGSLGPVSEGLFIWLIGLGGLIAVAIWLTARSN
ncbi:cytochrome c [Pontimonas sp.]|jgi:ubiquinol-cytochrome c reductase cytochrome c subunit|nr:cytochrome c [Pontimonas sp.]